ncbi:MAG TPA: VWA domain-containing protein [Vicinamibacterales bacterium]|nr:VWA domain-containing protein [Vicinamibacterales bacterium]
MELLAPAFLWWLLALGVLLLLPRLRRPRRQVASATLHLWQQARGADARTLRVRLRRHLLLLVQAAALVAIVFALARPVLITRAGDIAIIVDVSASMGAWDGGAARLDLARDEARRIVRSLPYGSRVWGVSAGDTVRTHVPSGRGSDGFDAFLASLRPADGAADIDGAVEVARAAGVAQIVVVSDDPSAPADPNVRVIPIGSPASNVSLALFAARRVPESPIDYEVVVEIRSFAGETSRPVLTVSGESGPLHSEPLEIGPGGRALRTLLLGPQQGRLTARLEVDDALEADNERTVTLPQPARVRVHGTASRFVRAALNSNPAVRLLGTGPETADVIVCAGCSVAPPDAPGVLLVASTMTPPADAEPVATGGRAVGRRWLRRQQRLMRLELDTNDPAVVRDAVFPVAMAESVAWLARSDSVDDGRFPEREADLRQRPAERSVVDDRPERTPVTGRLALTALLLAAALALVATEWALASRGTAQQPVAIRAVVLACLVAAAAGLSVPVGRGPAAVIFAIDRSSSMSAAAQAGAERRMAAMAARMQPGDAAGIVSFGADAIVQRPLASSLAATSSTALVGTRATNIAAGIQVARNVVGHEGARRIVLLTDGAATHGDAVSEAAIALADGIVVDAVAVGGGRASAALVTGVQAPPAVRAGEPFEVTVTAEGPPGMVVPVTIFRDGSELARQPARIDTDGTGVVRVIDRMSPDAVVTYTAAIGPDALPESASSGVATVSLDPQVVLYIGPRVPVSARAGLAVEHADARRLPASGDRLAHYSTVVLDNVDAQELTDDQARALRDYVARGGGGLLVRGGPGVLGPAGYPQTPLDAALPIDFRSRGGSRAPDMALVVAFDKSGSMADAAEGTTKIELARRAVLAVRDVLPAGDTLGVIAFDAAPADVLPLAPTPPAAYLAERLAPLLPHGATRIAPAIARAREWLSASAAARKHIILITDGRSDDRDAAEVIAGLRGRETGLTIIAVGEDADREFFERLAARTGAAVHQPSRLSDLPKIVAREAARTAGGSVVREPFVPRVVTAHPILRATTTLPEVPEYAAGAARSDAVTVLASHLGDPVLAVRQHGLGRVGVLSAEDPRADPDLAFASLWTEAIRWAGAYRAASPLALAVSARDDGAWLAVDAVDPDAGVFLNGLDASAAVRTPSGEIRTVTLAQTAPGRYGAAVPLDERGTHVITAVLRGRGGNEHVLRRAFYWTAPAERPRPEPDVHALERIVAAGGGRLLADGESPFDVERPARHRDVSTELALAALVLFLLDIARRGGVPWRALTGRGKAMAHA